MKTTDEQNLRISLAGELSTIIASLDKIKPKENDIPTFQQIKTILQAMRDWLANTEKVLDKKILARQTYLVGRCIGQFTGFIESYEADWPNVAAAFADLAIRLKNFQNKLQELSELIVASQN